MPEEFDAAMRCSVTPEMRNRRWIVGLSMFSTTIMSGIGLYQTGIFNRLPEPRCRWFDSTKVTGSAEAYSLLQTPDALLGMLSYSMTAALAGMGGDDRVRRSPMIAAAMGAKLAGDAALSITMATRQWSRYRALCFWCLLATAATLSAAVLGIPEAAAAARRIGLQHHEYRS